MEGTSELRRLETARAMLQDVSPITIVAVSIELPVRLCQVKESVDIGLGTTEAPIETGGTDSDASSNNRK